jgi:hypothetical protein
MKLRNSYSVMPVKTGIHSWFLVRNRLAWIPAFAGMTDFVHPLDSRFRGYDGEKNSGDI